MLQIYSSSIYHAKTSYIAVLVTKDDNEVIVYNCVTAEDVPTYTHCELLAIHLAVSQIPEEFNGEDTIIYSGNPGLLQKFNGCLRGVNTTNGPYKDYWDTIFKDIKRFGITYASRYDCFIQRHPGTTCSLMASAAERHATMEVHQCTQS